MKKVRHNNLPILLTGIVAILVFTLMFQWNSATTSGGIDLNKVSMRYAHNEGNIDNDFKFTGINKHNASQGITIKKQSAYIYNSKGTTVGVDDIAKGRSAGTSVQNQVSTSQTFNMRTGNGGFVQSTSMSSPSFTQVHLTNGLLADNTVRSNMQVTRAAGDGDFGEDPVPPQSPISGPLTLLIFILPYICVKIRKLA